MKFDDTRAESASTDFSGADNKIGGRRVIVPDLPDAPQYTGLEYKLGAAMSCAWSAALVEPSNLSPDSNVLPKIA